MESWDDRRRRTESFPAICRGCSTRHRFRIYWKAVAGRVDGIRRELPAKEPESCAAPLRGIHRRKLAACRVARIPFFGKLANILIGEIFLRTRGQPSEKSISATRDREILKNWKEEESQDRKICSCTR